MLTEDLKPADYMRPGKIDYRKIDPGVRDVVRELNRIPFVRTVASCEGHVMKRWEKYRADDGCLFLYQGFVGMDIDERDEHARCFITDVAEMTRKYPFANFGKIYRGSAVEGPDGRASGRIKSVYGSHVLAFNTAHSGVYPFDLGRAHEIRGTDTEEVISKKLLQADEESVRKRKAQYQEVWRNLGIIAVVHQDV